MTECASLFLMHEEAVWSIKLSGTDSKRKKNERKRNWNTIIPLMILKLLSFIGCLPRHPLIDSMVQVVNLVLEFQSNKFRKQSIVWKNFWNNLRNCSELWCVCACMCMCVFVHALLYLLGEFERKREIAHKIEEQYYHRLICISGCISWRISRYLVSL